MGNIVGGLIGGIGSLFGGKSAKSNDLTGYNYLAGNPAIQTAQGAVAPSSTAQNTALQGQQGIANTENALLTGGPGSGPAFQNYLNSTGYNFQQDQGTRAITGSAAARGLLGSGSTAKALTQYGQGLGSSYFNNYLNQLNNNASTYGNVASGYGSRVGQGLTAANAVGEAGTSGGAKAGDAMQTGTTNFFGKLAGIATQLPF